MVCGRVVVVVVVMMVVVVMGEVDGRDVVGGVVTIVVDPTPGCRGERMHFSLSGAESVAHTGNGGSTRAHTMTQLAVF